MEQLTVAEFAVSTDQGDPQMIGWIFGKGRVVEESDKFKIRPLPHE
jgi:hypothetical protein